MSDFTSVRISDGTEMRVYVARPPSGKGPAILVFQEAFGVNAHIRDVTERFAELGYLAAAPEVFHRSAPPGFEGNYSDFPSVQPHMKAMTNEGLEADIRATYELLRNDNACNGRFASIGFCMGGRVSYLAN